MQSEYKATRHRANMNTYHLYMLFADTVCPNPFINSSNHVLMHVIDSWLFLLQRQYIFIHKCMLNVLKHGGLENPAYEGGSPIPAMKQAVLLTIGQSYIGNDITHSTLLILPKYRSVLVKQCQVH